MKKWIFAGVCIYLYAAAVVPVFAYDDGDLQVWNTGIVEGKLNDRLKVKVEEELRFGDDVSELYYTHTDGGFTYNVTGGLDLGMNYRQVYEKKNGEWKEENRPHANGTVKWHWYGIGFSDRNRIELRIPEGKDDEWRYRNKLTAAFPVKWARLDMEPYAADEIFVDLHGNKFNRNRLYAGFKIKLLEHLKSDVFYLWQASEKKNKWTSYNVIGIKVKAVF